MTGQYAPGFLTDLVREIRDAARLREDALYSRVRAMVVERNDVSIKCYLINICSTYRNVVSEAMLAKMTRNENI